MPTAAVSIPNAKMKRTPRLPPEIEEMVFQHLARRELAVCSTVCARWYQRLVPLVYEQIEWMNTKRLVKTVKCFEAAIAWRAEQGKSSNQQSQSHMWRLANTPAPIVHVKKLVGWFEPDTALMSEAHRSLAALCDMLIAHSDVLAATAVLNDSSVQLPITRSNSLQNTLLATEFGSSQNTLEQKCTIDSIHVDINFVAEPLLMRLVDANAHAITNMRVCGISPSLFTSLAHSAPKLKSLDLSSEREEVKLVATQILRPRSSISMHRSVSLPALQATPSLESDISAVAPAAEPPSVAGLTDSLADEPQSMSTPSPNELATQENDPTLFQQRVLSSALCFPSLETLSISATSERPRYSLLTIDNAFLTPVLCHLNLYFVHLTDQTLQTLLMRNRRSLVSLTLGYVTGLSDNALGSVPFLCPELTDLELTYTNISDAGLDLLGNQTQHIERLTLVGNHKLTDDGVSRLAHAWRTSLRHVDLGGSMPGVTDESLLSIINVCENIDSIRIRQLENITDTAFTKIPETKCAKTLRHIEVRWCKHVTPKQLAGLSTNKRMRSLKTISIIHDEEHADRLSAPFEKLVCGNLYNDPDTMYITVSINDRRFMIPTI